MKNVVYSNMLEAVAPTVKAIAKGLENSVVGIDKIITDRKERFSNNENDGLLQILILTEFPVSKEIQVYQNTTAPQDAHSEKVLDAPSREVVQETVPIWKDLLDNLRANNGIAEIKGRITHVAIVGIIGDDLVIIPTKAIKVKDKLNWKAELKALKLDDKIVLESDKFIAKLDVITDAPDIEEMIRKYNDSVEVDKRFTGFINI